MSEPKLDWSHAEVRDRKLTLPVSGMRPPGWSDSFEKTVHLLGTGGWKDITLKKRGIRVGGVHPGSEEKLRHFLESAVQQANQAHREADAEAGAEAPEDGAQESAAPDDDAAMTERFRSFGAADSEL